MNVLLFTVLHEIVLWQQRMRFYLVHLRYDARGLNDTLDLFHGEVGYADRADFARFEECSHCAPGIRESKVVDNVGSAVIALRA